MSGGLGEGWVLTPNRVIPAEAGISLALIRPVAIPAPPPAPRSPPPSLSISPMRIRFDDLECARLTALRRLLWALAPDLPALALKIALAIDEEAHP